MRHASQEDVRPSRPGYSDQKDDTGCNKEKTHQSSPSHAVADTNAVDENKTTTSCHPASSVVHQTFLEGVERERYLHGGTYRLVTFQSENSIKSNIATLSSDETMPSVSIFSVARSW